MERTHTDSTLGVATATAAIVMAVLLAAAVWMGALVVRLVAGEFADGLRALSLGGL